MTVKIKSAGVLFHRINWPTNFKMADINEIFEFFWTLNTTDKIVNGKSRSRWTFLTSVQIFHWRYDENGSQSWRATQKSRSASACLICADMLCQKSRYQWASATNGGGSSYPSFDTKESADKQVKSTERGFPLTKINKSMKAGLIKRPQRQVYIGQNKRISFWA